jgi:polysaccharide biosynthesis protein VpsQ
MKFVRFITFGFILFVVYIIWAADNGTMPPIIFTLYHFPYGDKIGHFLLLGMLAFLINGNLPGRTLKLFSLSIPIGALLTISFAVLEEVSQLFFPARTFSLLDLGSSLLGIGFFSFLSSCLIKHLIKKYPSGNYSG